MPRALEVFRSPLSLARPLRATEVSAWKEHVPFALDLVAALRPGVVVELGVHAGDSYCALCQAVAALGLPARCFGVDTWEGDAQAGRYGPEVLAELRAHHDPAYGAFSRLVQGTFDDARAHFADGSVDLLHVDGLHTYEAVRHDVEAWLPALSSRGVLLLHDTQVRERDFGVWRLWEELRERHPSFEFHHGHGLGVLAVGPERPPALQALLDAGEEERQEVRACYAELGRLRAVEEAAGRSARALGQAQAELGALRGEAAALRAEVATAREEAEAARQAREEAEAARQARELAEAEAAAARQAAQAARAEARAARGETEEARRETERARAALERQQAENARIVGTAAWQAATRYWRLRDRLLAEGGRPRQALRRVTALLAGRPAGAPAPVPAAGAGSLYDLWLARHAPGPAAEAARRERAARLGDGPLVSVLTPVHDVDETWLRRCLESVLAQAYPRWELCLVDDASTRPHVAQVLEEYAARDPRVRFTRLARNEGIGAASARALSMAAGEWVALLDHDDELAPEALLEVASAAARHPDADLVYTDEDKLDPQGRRVEPFFKPDWSPDLLLSMNYLCHLTAVRRALLEEVGGFRPGFDGSQDHDVVLRVSERARRVVHVPQVLYHWRQLQSSAAAARTAKPWAVTAGRRAVEEALARRGLAGQVEVPHPGTYRVVHALPDPPLVTLVIPTRDRLDLLRPCVDSILRRTDYPRYELLVIDNGSTDPATLRWLSALPSPHRVVRHDAPFNWSALNNLGARQARGDLLLFMNNDMEVREPGWLRALVEHGVRPDVGAVGAKLLYPDGSLQHAGVVLGVGGVAGHAFKHAPGDAGAYFRFPQVVREVSAVTGACMLVRRRVFEEVGGFDEVLRVAFNDVDFCLRVRAAGLRILYTPFAVLTHHESASRGPSHPPEDEALMRRRWAEVLASDPYYSPHLTLDHEDYRLRA